MTTVWYQQPKARVSPRDVEYFDEIRRNGHHPAAHFGQLPEEVQTVISGLQIENYDLAQQALYRSALFWIGAGIVWLILGHFGHIARIWIDAPNAWDYLTGIALMALGGYRIYQANRVQMPNLNERFREEWELDFVAKKRSPIEH